MIVLLIPVLPDFQLQANGDDLDQQNALIPDESENIRSDREEVSAVEDGSIAEAVDRRPDLQFRNIKLEGEEAAISLDDLSSEVVSSLEVLRAVTPEMDADAEEAPWWSDQNPPTT